MLINEKISPNGYYKISHYRSNGDGVGQAPYGDHLLISHTQFSIFGNKEETIFAGYCEPKFNYEWEGNKLIKIWCKNPEGSHKALSSLAYGIKINLLNEKDQ